MIKKKRGGSKFPLQTLKISESHLLSLLNVQVNIRVKKIYISHKCVLNPKIETKNVAVRFKN